MEPVEVSSAGVWPFNLAVDEGYVYWTPLNGDVMRASVAGERATRIAVSPGVTLPGSLAIDEDSAYYALPCGGKADCGHVMRVAKDGQDAPVSLSSGTDPFGVALTDEYVYWIDSDQPRETERFRRVRKVGGSSETLRSWKSADSPQSGEPHALASDGHLISLAYTAVRLVGEKHLVVYDELKNAFVEDLVLQLDQEPAFELRARANKLFWTTSRALFSAKIGEAPSSLVTSEDILSGLEVDDSYVYWFSDRAVLKMPIAGGPTEFVAHHDQRVAGEPGQVAINDLCVFWTRTDGRIVAIRK